MNAAVLTTPGSPLTIRCEAIPTPGPGQILVRLKACGVCHSDVHIWKGDVTATPVPSLFILGHEGVGTIEALGPGVEDWTPGDAIGVPWLHDTCMQCDECLAGEESFCQQQRAHGLNVPGAFADYVVVDARFAVRLIPEMDPLTTAPVMCAGVTAYGAIRRAGLKAGETCAIFGCGGLGLYAVQIATRLGVRVLAVDRSPAKLENALRLGAVETEIADEGLADRLGARGQKFHACINFAPTPKTWHAIISAIRPRGRIIAAALVSQPVEISQEWLTGTGVTITGTSVGTAQEMREVVAMHAQKPFEAEIEEISLDRASEALASLEKGNAKGRYVIRF
ncbi:propanol-preferring alcohol dehydrogenase [Pararhizobium capsulatum DSM 1112]|uniref:alcohol dehydrogenase n=1 Tax=Pararhizobium capsulatum DSM 1112 TaxID=1121113 RepID=A0ABU0BZ68_9HYPH|nr:alcohol dehydrogenase catalytic domain-containing protein [Pararhizobium capsulatum]MDQ0323258.1 propanol-preferring alcohol dehydrogenase [Pararhizobium capsulatum DSM 1112]